MKFKALAVAAILVATGLMAPPAQAADTLRSKFLVDEVTSRTGYDRQSTIEIESPQIIFCSGSCNLSVQARFTNNNPSSSPVFSLINSGGTTLATATMNASNRTNWQTLNFSFSANSNMDVTFHIVDTAAYKMFSGSRKLTRVQAGSTPSSPEPYLTWPNGSSTGSVMSSTFGSGRFRFLDAYLPDQIDTAGSCAQIPIWFQPRDISTGAPKMDNGSLSIGLAFQVNGGPVTSVSYSDSSWVKGAPTKVLPEVCGLVYKQGSTNIVDVTLSAIYPGQSASSGSDGSVTVNGTVVYNSINCLKGKYIKTINAANPVCPAGYKRTNIKPVNGMVPPSTISCVKGFTVKKVTGVLPSCPAGYRKR
jgi:hypothetical protein